MDNDQKQAEHMITHLYYIDDQLKILEEFLPRLSEENKQEVDTKLTELTIARNNLFNLLFDIKTGV